MTLHYIDLINNKNYTFKENADVWISLQLTLTFNSRLCTIYRCRRAGSCCHGDRSLHDWHRNHVSSN